ncbi:MAG: BatD family protein, partial [Chromatiaceae bacterium]
MRNRSTLFLSLLILFALSVSQGARADRLIADPDRTRLGVNETITLRVIAEGRLSGDPDLSPLEKDFEVLNRSTNSRMTIVNGAMSQTREWVLELAPRRSGELQIPAFSLGGERTSPIQVQVVAADQAAAESGPRPLFVDASVDDPSPYVQQPFIYRVKVIYLEQPRRATLSDPVADGATIEQRGDDQSYSEQIDGRRYTVIERRYLVVPQRSGPLTIRSPRLEAVLPDKRPGARRGPFADFEDAFGGRVFQNFPALSDLGSERRVLERGPDRTVDVRAQPPSSGTAWLPAESVELTDEWTPSPPQFRVGEPV